MLDQECHRDHGGHEAMEATGVAVEGSGRWQRGALGSVTEWSLILLLLLHIS